MQKKQFHEKIRLTNSRKNGLLYNINELLMRDWNMTSEKKKNRKVYIVGHKNPDTDSICSALAYANLKRKVTGQEYVAKRAGQVNEETQYILDRFGVEEPGLLSNVQIQVKDLDISRVAGIEGHVSIKEAWRSMKESEYKDNADHQGNSTCWKV